MKKHKKELTRNEFAKWVYSVGQKLQNYNFDVFYDIHMFMESENKTVIDKYGDKRIARSCSEKPIINTFYYFVKDFGTHLLREEYDDDTYKLLEREAKQIYKITICVNRDYFGIPYAMVEQLG